MKYRLTADQELEYKQEMHEASGVILAYAALDATSRTLLKKLIRSAETKKIGNSTLGWVKRHAIACANTLEGMVNSGGTSCSRQGNNGAPNFDDYFHEVCTYYSTLAPRSHHLYEIYEGSSVIKGAAVAAKLGKETKNKHQKQITDAMNLYMGRRTQFVEANQGLVQSIASKFQNLGLDFEDLYAEGQIGLLKAIDRFDYHRKLKFSTYATNWIRQMISRSLYNDKATVRIPVHSGELLSKIRKASVTLIHNLGRMPTASEIADYLKISPKKVEMLTGIQAISLHAEEGDHQSIETCLYDNSNASPMLLCEQTLFQDELETLLESLSEREAKVIILRFGLHDGFRRSLEEVGQSLHRTRERVRQIEMIALRKLRKKKEIRSLQEGIYSFDADSTSN